MPQKLIQQQVQKQQQVQRLSAQQMLQVRLLEMPLTELEESIYAQLDDNPALESSGSDEPQDNEYADNDGSMDSSDIDDDFDAIAEREARKDALDTALERIGQDDEMPEASHFQSQQSAEEYEEIVYGDTTSFYDKLNEQLAEHELNEKQRYIIEYLIGSLDDDGLLRKSLDALCDELAIYHGIDTTDAELEETIAILQDFDPPGIGARSLQECLLIQLDRSTATPTKMLAREVIEKHFEAFKKKHWQRIQNALHLDDQQVADIQQEIRRLNPKPGAAMSETQGRNTQQITPDFIIDTDDNGNISFQLNQGNIPELHVSPAFTDMVEAYRGNKGSMNRQQKEALLYAKEKIDKAKGFIEAVKQRRQTMTMTMKAIINWQRKFFLDGDESDLRPMILKDIAEQTGLDISTVSRVSNIKYAQTRWGTFPLRFFFTDSYTTEDGEEMSTRKIKLALKDVIDNEDKKHPMSDEALTTLMKQRGYPIARRTVAKYREQLGLPVARLRKE